MMLSKKKFPNLNRALRRGIPASIRKGARNPETLADTCLRNVRELKATANG